MRKKGEEGNGQMSVDARANVEDRQSKSVA